MGQELGVERADEPGDGAPRPGRAPPSVAGRGLLAVSLRVDLFLVSIVNPGRRSALVAVLARPLAVESGSLAAGEPFRSVPVPAVRLEVAADLEPVRDLPPGWMGGFGDEHLSSLSPPAAPPRPRRLVRDDPTSVSGQYSILARGREVHVISLPSAGRAGRWPDAVLVPPPPPPPPLADGDAGARRSLSSADL